MKEFNLGLVYLHKGGFASPLGLMSIASYLKKYIKSFPVSIKIVDINFEDVLMSVLKEDFDLVGISAMTIEYKRAIKLAKEIKKQKPDLKVIIGGVHISTLPQSLHPVFDFGVIGEGEETMREVVSLFAGKKLFTFTSLKNVKGLVLWNRNKIVITKERPLIQPLDKIPMVDRTLINKDFFKRYPLTSWGEFGREGVILTSRGCPYRCVFCSTRNFWKIVRFHSVDYVVRDIKDLMENYGITHIQIWDDLFTIDKDRLRQMVKRFHEEGIIPRVKFSCQPRANLIDEEMCQILKDLNVKIVMFGFESGSESTLQFLKAGTVSVSQNKKAVKLCVKYGFKVQGSVIFGSPGEKIKDMRKTIDFLRFSLKEGAERLWSFVLTPFPATLVWGVAKRRGKVSDNMDWEELSLKSDVPLCLDDDVDREEFKKIFLESKSISVRFKLKKAWSFFKNNPFLTVYYFLKTPAGYISELFSKRDF